MLDYWDRYWEETLRKLDPQTVYRELSSKGTPDVALLCFERFSDFCHRHIVAHWLTQNVGVVIREYGQEQKDVFGG